MKALSLKQPFAELIVSGKKTIELRKWKTSFRGLFLIHASKNPDSKAMKGHGFKDLPLGCIVGQAVLKDVKEYAGSEDFFKDKDKHLASQDFGNYGFILEDAKRLPEVQCPGKLNFWEFKG